MLSRLVMPWAHFGGPYRTKVVVADQPRAAPQTLGRLGWPWAHFGGPFRTKVVNRRGRQSSYAINLLQAIPSGYGHLDANRDLSPSPKHHETGGDDNGVETVKTPDADY